MPNKTPEQQMSEDRQLFDAIGLNYISSLATTGAYKAMSFEQFRRLQTQARIEGMEMAMGEAVELTRICCGDNEWRTQRMRELRTRLRITEEKKGLEG